MIDAGRSRRRAVRLAREALAKAGANVLGAVLNRIPARANSDYASYYGGHYESTEQAERPARVPDASPELTGPSAHLPESAERRRGVASGERAGFRTQEAGVDSKRALDVCVGSVALVLADTDPGRGGDGDAAVGRPGAVPVPRPAGRRRCLDHHGTEGPDDGRRRERDDHHPFPRSARDPPGPSSPQVSARRATPAGQRRAWRDVPGWPAAGGSRIRRPVRPAAPARLLRAARHHRAGAAGLPRRGRASSSAPTQSAATATRSCRPSSSWTPPTSTAGRRWSTSGSCCRPSAR